MKFTSKRNHVSLENSVVIKRFSLKTAYETELKTARKLQNTAVNVANIIHVGVNIIHYEYLEGEVYAQLCEGMNAPMAQALCDWLLAYYKLQKMSPADVNLRNFIYNEGAGICYGLDFEDEEISQNAERDFGKMLAFCATYEPIFSQNKVISCRNLLSAFTKSAELSGIKSAFFEELNAMKTRRAKGLALPITAKDFWESVCALPLHISPCKITKNSVKL